MRHHLVDHEGDLVTTNTTAASKKQQFFLHTKKGLNNQKNDMMFPSTAALDMTGSSAFTIEADSVEDPKLSTLKVHSGHLHQGIPGVDPGRTLAVKNLLRSTWHASAPHHRGP